eukprot:122297_1
MDTNFFQSEAVKREINKLEQNKFSKFLIPRITDLSGINGVTVCPSSCAKWTQEFNVDLWPAFKGQYLNVAKHISLRKCLTENTSEWIKNFTNMRFMGFRGLANITYPTQYGNKSFYFASHVADIIKKQCIADAVIMNVSFDAITRKTRKVDNETKAMIDNVWKYDYPQNMKQRYQSLKDILLKNSRYLKQNVVNNANKQLLLSYEMNLRYCDQDHFGHLNQATYFHYVEECLFDYFYNTKMNKNIVFESMTAVFWNEIAIKKNKSCFVNIWEIKTIGNGANAMDFYGSIDIKNEKNEWVHNFGFVMRVLNVNKSKL